MIAEEMRNSRKKSSSIFLQFCFDKKNFKNCLFCFFEGEDNKYYGPRIEQYTKYNKLNIIKYDCCGREEVMRVYYLISSEDNYKYVKKMFFIDRDYNPIDKELDDVFQTPGYSIENFYSSKKCFSSFLLQEFGMNSIDDDFKMCIDDYEKRQKRFRLETLCLNAWLSCQAKKEKEYKENKIVFSNIKLSKFFSIIAIDEIVIQKQIDLSFLNEYFKNHYEISKENLNSEIELFKKNGDFYRGKFELEFIYKIICSIISKNKDKTYFKKFYSHVKEIQRNNLISHLSYCADTPDCLIEFLKKHRV